MTSSRGPFGIFFHIFHIVSQSVSEPPASCSVDDAELRGPSHGRQLNHPRATHVSDQGGLRPLYSLLFRPHDSLTV